MWPSGCRSADREEQVFSSRTTALIDLSTDQAMSTSSRATARAARLARLKVEKLAVQEKLAKIRLELIDIQQAAQVKRERDYREYQDAHKKLQLQIESCDEKYRLMEEAVIAGDRIGGRRMTSQSEIRGKSEDCRVGQYIDCSTKEQTVAFSNASPRNSSTLTSGSGAGVDGGTQPSSKSDPDEAAGSSRACAGVESTSAEGEHRVHPGTDVSTGTLEYYVGASQKDDDFGITNPAAVVGYRECDLPRPQGSTRRDLAEDDLLQILAQEGPELADGDLEQRREHEAGHRKRMERNQDIWFDSTIIHIDRWCGYSGAVDIVCWLSSLNEKLITHMKLNRRSGTTRQLEMRGVPALMFDQPYKWIEFGMMLQKLGDLLYRRTGGWKCHQCQSDDSVMEVRQQMMDRREAVLVCSQSVSLSDYGPTPQSSHDRGGAGVLGKQCYYSMIVSRELRKKLCPVAFGVDDEYRMLLKLDDEEAELRPPPKPPDRTALRVGDPRRFGVNAAFAETNGHNLERYWLETTSRESHLPRKQRTDERRCRCRTMPS